MTRSEAEEIFIAVVMSGESCAIEMTLKETQVFRVLVGRTLQEMEKKNRTLWLKARDFGIEYREPYAVVRKLENDRYKMFKLKDGKLSPFEKLNEGQSMQKNVITEEGESDEKADKVVEDEIGR
jgi:hypothetical protein